MIDEDSITNTKELIFINQISIKDSSLPIMSFVVVNHNYGRFLHHCIESIFSQTYQNIECVIVDNASSDNTLEVIDRCRALYPSLTTLMLPVNIGQTLACQRGFSETAGAYVAFIDADDYLLPDFAETHIAVHLSLSVAVGFTSSDMVQVFEDRVVLAGVFDGAGAILDKNSAALNLRTERQFFATSSNLRIFPKTDLRKLSLRLVHRSNTMWVWAPTSGNVYRRDAAVLFMSVEGSERLRGAFDALLNYPINALTGSVLIERSLGAYRIHSKNMFSKHPSLNMLRAYNHDTDDAHTAVLLVLDHMTKNMDIFYNKSADPRELWRSMNTLRRKVNSHGQISKYINRLMRFVMTTYWKVTVRDMLKSERKRKKII